MVLTSKNVPRKNMGQNSRVFTPSRITILWSLLFNTCKQLYFVRLYNCLLEEYKSDTSHSNMAGRHKEKYAFLYFFVLRMSLRDYMNK